MDPCDLDLLPIDPGTSRDFFRARNHPMKYEVSKDFELKTIRHYFPL